MEVFLGQVNGEAHPEAVSLVEMTALSSSEGLLLCVYGGRALCVAKNLTMLPLRHDWILLSCFYPGSPLHERLIVKS